MIKRIEFVTRRAELSQAAFHALWLDAYTRSTHAPHSGAPRRSTACLVLHDAAGCDAAHDAITVEWFDDTRAAKHYAAPPTAAELIEPGASVCIFTEELVLRGSDWLDQ